MEYQANSRVVREKMDRLKARQGARRLIIATPWRSKRPVAIFSSYPTKGLGRITGRTKANCGTYLQLVFGNREQAGQ
jgi:hypothetical protein